MTKNVFGVTLHQNLERWVMCMRVMDIVEDLLIEFEHLENMLEILEIGFENCTNGDHKCETSSIYIISKYLEMIKTEYIEKLAETL